MAGTPTLPRPPAFACYGAIGRGSRRNASRAYRSGSLGRWTIYNFPSSSPPTGNEATVVARNPGVDRSHEYERCDALLLLQPSASGVSGHPLEIVARGARLIADADTGATVPPSPQLKETS